MNRFGDTQQRLLNRSRAWMVPPATLDRGYLVCGYMLYLVLGLAVIFARSPALDVARSNYSAVFVGALVAALSVLSAIASTQDRWYRIEAASTLLIACTLAGYTYAALEIIIISEGERGTVGFVLVFIITALMWARGLTLGRRWIYERVTPRGGRK